MRSAARPPSKVPPLGVIPPPGTASSLDPLLTTWAAGREIHRCYDGRHGPTGFHDGGRRRFHPVVPAGSTAPLPVLYGADDFDGAVFETVFRNVPVRGTRRVPYSNLVHRLVAVVVASRDLTLVDLTSVGPGRLGLTPAELTESGAPCYPQTAAWARALHDHAADIDGLLWVSRQLDTSRALVLFGDRVESSELELAQHPLLTLGGGPGLTAVSAAANRAGITITGL